MTQNTTDHRTCITFTLFDLKFLDEFYHLVKDILEGKLKYKIEKLIIGKHSKAKREHYHLAVLVSYSNKPLIHLNRRLTPLINTNGRKVDFKISFYHNDDPKYDEQKPFMYPLKESQNQEENKTLYDKYHYNILLSEFNHYSVTAIGIYDKMCYDLERKQKQQQQEEETTENKYKYLDNELFNIQDYDKDTIYPTGEFRSYNIEKKLKMVCKSLLRYQRILHHERHKKVFKITSIMDLAISYLYFRDLVSEDELLEWKYRI